MPHLRTGWLPHVLVVAGFALLAVVALTRGPRVSRATMEQVKVGMTRAEVITTVGGEPGDYTSGRWDLTFQNISGPNPPHIWVCGNVRLVVSFQDGRVTRVDLTPASDPVVHE
jgi:hypothetical protein